MHSTHKRYYVSDLAWTVPVSGRFTPAQRLAYDTYLVSYEAGLAAIRPGVPYVEASRVAGKAVESRLATLPAWLKDPATVGQSASNRGWYRADDEPEATCTVVGGRISSRRV